MRKVARILQIKGVFQNILYYSLKLYYISKFIYFYSFTLELKLCVKNNLQSINLVKLTKITDVACHVLTTILVQRKT